MEPTFEICETREDYAAVIALETEILLASGSPVRPKVQSEQRFKDKEILLVKLDAQIIGYFIFHVHPDGMVYPVSIGILPEYRRQHIGSTLRPFMRQLLISRGGKWVKIFSKSDTTSKYLDGWAIYMGQEVQGGIIYDVWHRDLTGPYLDDPTKPPQED